MRRIKFLADCGDRKAGAEYLLDSALAEHYVVVRKIATYCDEPQPVEDRMIGGTPRGRRRTATEEG